MNHEAEQPRSTSSVRDTITVVTTHTDPSTKPDRLDLVGKHVHLVGIGGCGMSALARLIRGHGAVCTGSDMAGSEVVDSLRDEGFSVTLEQSARTVPDPCDLVVVSAAIQGDHSEITEAERRRIEVLKYAQMVGRFMIGRVGVAVAGTHGKSTTTSMLSHVLIQAGLDPSFIVGANCEQIGGGSRCGSGGSGVEAREAGPILIAEACEYDRSFHNLHPTHAMILNVEADHLDIYRSLDEIVEAFAVFAQKVRGTMLINHEMTHRLAITAGLRCEVQTVGFASEADWRIEVDPTGVRRGGVGPRAPGPIVRLHHRGSRVAEWLNPLPGDHMAYNAAAAAIMANRLGAAWDQVTEAMAGFRGLDRRMQLVGQVDSLITIFDDYGHHPTEIDTTLRALRQHYRPLRLICVFQPHQHSRTRFLMEQFAVSFSGADIVIVPDIYFVRDSEQDRKVTAADLVDRLRQRGVTAMHLYPFGAIVEQLQVITRPGDLVVTMGAGDVWKIAREFVGLWNDSNSA